MSAATIKNPFLAPDSKHEVAKKWLQRHLYKTTPRNPVALTRPQTAPSTGTAEPGPLPADLQRPANPERSWSSQAQPSDPAPSRPDSGVTRHVNAWLDANGNATPLMDGLPYWRSAAMTDAMAPSGSLQYAVPVMQPHEERPSIDHSQHIRAFYRRVKKVQVRMPSLLRTVPQRPAAQTQSSSMPTLHMSRSAVGAPSRGRRTNAVLRQTPESREHGQSIDSGARVSRGGSTGDASDAPTYYTGPPPSYHSRAVSTTSSFGCVDGMGPVHRQTTHNRSVRVHGVRGKLKELQRRLKVP
jgi:hypothetical protein